MDMPLGVHQDSFVPAGAYIVGYDVLGHLLTLLLSGQLCFWAAMNVNIAFGLSTHLGSCRKGGSELESELSSRIPGEGQEDTN
jgi:hypothetical protein